MDGNKLRDLVLTLVCMIISLTVHEFAHALVATKLGDDTAEREGRLTLSPLSHIDVFGTLIFPAMGALFGGGAFIGWAKPVPVTPTRFRRGVDMRTGMALTAAAGPLSNLLLAVLSIGALWGLREAGMMQPGSLSALKALLVTLFFTNIGLCVFNFLPLPPFDGSRLLPRSLDDLVEKIAPYSFFILMGILMVPQLRAVLIDLPREVLAKSILRMFGFA